MQRDYFGSVTRGDLIGWGSIVLASLNAKLRVLGPAALDAPKGN